VRYPRLVPRDDACAAKLARRTLTNLYNERPTWLDLAHRKLDEAVFAAYGWPPDLPDEAILEKLLALNLERAGGRWRASPCRHRLAKRRRCGIMTAGDVARSGKPGSRRAHGRLPKGMCGT
jgi:hypothetical protein